jgi:hypothetical protein
MRAPPSRGTVRLPSHCSQVQVHRRGEFGTAGFNVGVRCLDRLHRCQPSSRPGWRFRWEVAALLNDGRAVLGEPRAKGGEPSLHLRSIGRLCRHAHDYDAGGAEQFAARLLDAGARDAFKAPVPAVVGQ